MKLNSGIEKLRKLHGIIHDAKERKRIELGKVARIKRNTVEKKKINIQEISIISNTCIGGVICHDLGLKFCSPTVNIYIRPKDFVRFCENIQKYLQLPLTELPYDKQIGYPVALLGDIPLYCKHYVSFEEVTDSWTKRKHRIQWNNVVFIMTDRDFVPPISVNHTIQACDEDTIRRFEELPFKRKVCIVQNQAYKAKYASCRQLLKGGQGNCVGIITDVIGITGKRMYQYVKDFDYIKFLNGE